MSEPIPFHIRLSNALGVEPNTLMLDQLADMICPIIVQHYNARTMAEAVAAHHGLPITDKDGPLTVAEIVGNLSATLITRTGERDAIDADRCAMRSARDVAWIECDELREEVAGLRTSITRLEESLKQAHKERDAAVSDRTAARSAAKMEADALRRQHATQIRALHTALAAAGNALTQTAEANL